MWVVTTTIDADVPMDQMDEWEDALADVDGVIARRPRVLYADDRTVTDVTVHVDASDDIAAMSRARTLVETVIGSLPVLATDVVDEQLYQDRAEAPTLPQLVSAPEIADTLGVSRQRVHQLRDTAGFPAPLFVLRTGAIWAASAIDAFARTWTRAPGPRPKTA
ncbi:MAG: hypothetical protein J2P18_08555 [Nocardia sp.]|nr:hypothetical protein [Nocardia sp.]